MKEAAGEANMTVITIVLIGVVAAVGVILVPKILDSSARKSACAEMAGNLKKNGNTWECHYKLYNFRGQDYPEGRDSFCTIIKCKVGSNNGKWVCASTCTNN